jgi:hypothetical protein
MSLNAEANTALSITLTAAATVGAIVLTPLNLSFWGGLYPPAASILTTMDVSFGRVFEPSPSSSACPSSWACPSGGPLRYGHSD